MSDLSYTVEVKGIEDLARLESTLDKLQGTLNAGKGSGKALEEVRKILVGMKGTPSVLEDLSSSIQNLGNATQSLERTFKSSLGGLARTLVTELKAVQASVATQGREMGMETGRAMSEGFELTGKGVVQKAKSIAAQARAAATAEYEKLVGKNPNAELTEQMAATISNLKAQGAQISNIHSYIVKEWEKYGTLTGHQISAASAKINAAQEKRLNEDRKFAAAEAAVIAAAEKQEGSRAAMLARAAAGLEKYAESKRAAYEKQLQADRTFQRAQEQSQARERESLERHMREMARIQRAFTSNYANWRMNSVAEVARSQVYSASRNPSGSYSNINTQRAVYVPDTSAAERSLRSLTEQQARLNGELARGTPQARGMEQSLRSLAVQGNDTHSAMRGLASGFNLLWLTWGNLGPLFAGAAISNSFMKTAKEGMAVAETLQTIASLGPATKEEIQGISDALIQMGRSSIYGPMETAEAMKTLVLAGLEANQALSALPTVLNFSLAGTTTIQEAADVLVSVTTAFGTGAAGFERSADIIMRAAADSKASVESFGSAMRTASVVGEQFGAAQEDVAVLIQYLANLGITGTAAGTAIRNMYADMTGRSGANAKLLKQLGLDFRDADGNMKSLLQTTKELNDVLSQYDAKSQRNILQALFGERGAKAAIAELAKFNEMVVHNGVVMSALQRDIENVKNSAGDSAIAAVHMATTTEKAFKSLGATFETTLYKAFIDIEPLLYNTAVRLREAIASPEFQKALSAMTSGVATLVSWLAENSKQVSIAVLSYAGFKTALSLTASAVVAVGTALDLLQVKKRADIALTGAQMAADQAAQRAATGAAVARFAGLTAILRVLPVVGTAVAIGGVAWSLYDVFAKKASNTIEDLANNKGKDIVEALRKENEHIRQVNILREQGIELMEAEARVKALNAKSENSNIGRSRLSEIDADLYKEQSRLLEARRVLKDLEESANTGYGIKGGAAHDVAVSKATREAAQAQERVNSLLRDKIDIVKQTAELERAIDIEEKERRKNARKTIELNTRDTEAAAKAANEAFNRILTGNKTFDLGDGAGGRGPFERAELDRSNERKKIEEDYASKLSLAKDYYTKEKVLLDAQFNAKLISESEYYSRSAASALEHEQDQIRILQEGLEKRTAASLEVITELQAKQASVKPSSKAWKDYAQQIENIENEVVSYTVKATNEIEKVKTESAHRLSLVTIKLAGETAQLIEKDKEFWEDSRRSQEKEAALKAIERQYNNVSKSVFSTGEAEKASALAIAKVNEETKKHIDTLKEKLKLQRANLEAAQAAALIALQDPTVDEDRRDVLAEQVRVAQKAVQDLEKVLEDSVEKGLRKGAEAGADAFNDVMYQNAMKFRDELSDILYDAITGNGASAGKALREMLKRELIKEPLTVAIRGVVGSVVGSLFGGGSGGIGAAGGGGIGSILSGANTLSSVYGAFSGGLTSGLAGTIGSLGSMFGSSALTSFAAGMKGATLAPGLMGPTTAGATGAMGAGSAFAAAMPWLVGLAALAAAWKPLFGRKLKDSGLEGTFGGESGFEGRMYEFYKGGLFRSNKTKYKDMDSGLQKMLATQFEALKKGATEMGVILGFSADTLDSFYSSIKVSFHGLKEEEVQKKLEEELDKLTESMAQQIIGSWETVTEDVQRLLFHQGIGEDTAGMRVVTETQERQLYVASEFAREGERAHETLARLSVSLSAVNSMFDMLAMNLYEATLAGGDLASQLLDLFGDAEQMVASANAYFRNFYSEEEQRAYSLRSITQKLAEVGVYTPNPGDKDALSQYRSLVEAQDLNTESGRKAYTVLLQLSEAFAEVTQSTQDAAEAIKSAFRQMQANLADVEGKFEGGGFSRQYKAENIAVPLQEFLSSLGIQKDVGGLTSAILAATSKDVENFFRDVWGVLHTIEAKEEFLSLTNSMLSFVEASDKAEASVEDLTKTIGDRLRQAFDAKHAAGTLYDQIDAAMGGSGDRYAKLRERDLWEAVGKGDYRQQIEIAQELADLTLERHNLEKRNAEQQIEFAKRLKTYVDSLKVGNLSPLTLGEKLVEASMQYQQTLAKARAGDETARGELQGKSSTYLELARQYYASNDTYTEIFKSVTGTLEGLSGVMLSDADRQIAVSTQSLESLQALKTILEGAYAEASADYDVQSLLMNQQLAHLQGIEGGIEEVREILGGMPALLALQLQGFNGTLNNPYVEAVDAPLTFSYTGEDMPTTIVSPAPLQWDGFTLGNDALISEVVALREELRKELQHLRQERLQADKHSMAFDEALAIEHAKEIVSGVGGAVQEGLYQLSVIAKAEYNK